MQQQNGSQKRNSKKVKSGGSQRVGNGQQAPHSSGLRTHQTRNLLVLVVVVVVVVEMVIVLVVLYSIVEREREESNIQEMFSLLFVQVV